MIHANKEKYNHIQDFTHLRGKHIHFDGTFVKGNHEQDSQCVEIRCINKEFDTDTPVALVPLEIADVLIDVFNTIFGAPEGYTGIDQDEPVFLLRARDALCAGTMKHWCDRAEQYVLNPNMISNVRQHAKAVEEFQETRGCSYPTQQLSVHQIELQFSSTERDDIADVQKKIDEVVAETKQPKEPKEPKQPK